MNPFRDGVYTLSPSEQPHWYNLIESISEANMRQLPEEKEMDRFSTFLWRKELTDG